MAEHHETLVMLGNGPSWTGGIKLAEQHGYECWGINYMNETVPHILTMGFQMHGDHFIKARFKDHYKNYPWKVPLVMWHTWAEFPTSVAFPIRDYQDCFGLERPYFACTMSFMLSLAIMMGRFKKIHIYGVDFYYELKHEFAYERPNFEFYMGWAMAKGIQLDLPENTRLMTTCDNLRQVYGREWNPPLTPAELDAVFDNPVVDGVLKIN
ncbi:hypothetical protein KAR91_60375 [Candidatus Pacearchaeota archaeon]|nr:hypothetical protein [Candidatus Pacearchaeota archaeon]